MLLDAKDACEPRWRLAHRLHARGKGRLLLRSGLLGYHPREHRRAGELKARLLLEIRDRGLGEGRLFGTAGVRGIASGVAIAAHLAAAALLFGGKPIVLERAGDQRIAEPEREGAQDPEGGDTAHANIIDRCLQEEELRSLNESWTLPFGSFDLKLRQNGLIAKPNAAITPVQIQLGIGTRMTINNSKVDVVASVFLMFFPVFTHKYLLIWLGAMAIGVGLIGSRVIKEIAGRKFPITQFTIVVASFWGCYGLWWAFDRDGAVGISSFVGPVLCWVFILGASLLCEVIALGRRSWSTYTSVIGCLLIVFTIATAWFSYRLIMGV